MSLGRWVRQRGEPVEDATCHCGTSQVANEAPCPFSCWNAESICDGAFGLPACGTVTSTGRQPMESDGASRARIAGEKEPVLRASLIGNLAHVWQRRMRGYEGYSLIWDLKARSISDEDIILTQRYGEIKRQRAVLLCAIVLCNPQLGREWRGSVCDMEIA